MEISIRSSKHKFNIIIDGKYNFISGDSATKKTLFNTLAILSGKSNRSVKMKVIDGNRILSKDEIHVFGNGTGSVESSILTKYTGHLFIIDEFSDILRDKLIGKTLSESKNYFLIISRRVIGYLSVSVDSIYQFTKVGNTIINTPKYVDMNSNLTEFHHGIQYVIGEDSVSSRLYFKHYFSHLDIWEGTINYNGRIVDMSNDKVHTLLEQYLESGKDNILVVFDSAAFGFYYTLLLEIIHKYADKHISILAWDSYESFLLECKPFQIILKKKDVGCKYNSVEQMSESFLSNLINYKKDRLPICCNGCENCRIHCKYRNKEIQFIKHPLTVMQSSSSDVGDMGLF